MKTRPQRTKWQKFKRRLAITGAGLGVLGVVSCGVTTRLVSEAIVQPTRKGVGAPVPDDLKARTFILPDRVEVRAWEARPAGTRKRSTGGL